MPLSISLCLCIFSVSHHLSLCLLFSRFVSYKSSFRKAMKLAVGFSLTLGVLLAMVNAEPEPKTYLVETGGRGR